MEEEKNQTNKKASDTVSQRERSEYFLHQFPLDIFSFPAILIKDNY